MHRVPLAQREYLDVRVVGKTPRSAETTTRHCQPGGEGHTFGADSESEFLGLQLWASTPVASPAALRHHPRQEPRALTRMRGSVRGDWRKPVPYRDVHGLVDCHCCRPERELCNDQGTGIFGRHRREERGHAIHSCTGLRNQSRGSASVGVGDRGIVIPPQL